MNGILFASSSILGISTNHSSVSQMQMKILNNHVREIHPFLLNAAADHSAT
jgi:hypothetical protein